MKRGLLKREMVSSGLEGKDPEKLVVTRRQGRVVSTEEPFPEGVRA